MNMGKSIAIKGELSGAEDLTLEGRVEGKISLPENVLTIGANASISAEIVARVVVVLGSVTGNVTAKEKFEIRSGGAMEGNLAAPRITMADGAIFSGKIDMPQGKGQKSVPAGDLAKAS